MVWKIFSFKSQSEPDQNRFILLKQQIVSSWPDIQKISPQLAIAIPVGFLFNWLHIPVGWLLGPMSVGIAYAILGGSRQPLPVAFTIVAQAIIALASATRFSLDTLVMAKTYALPLLFYILITGGLSVFNGYLLWRFSGLDMATSFVGCIPGAAPSLVAMSEEMGADASATAVLQYIRVFLVALIVPTVASLFFAIDSTELSTIAIQSDSNSPAPIVFNLLILAGCGALESWGGRRLNLPLSMFLGPFFLGLVAVWLLPYPLKMPQPVFAFGLLLLGLSIGLKFDWQTIRQLQKAVLLEIVLVLILILVCIGVGYEFHVLTNVDTLTAVLGSSPGAISAVMATVIQLGGDSGLVLAMQMSWMLTILLISPFIAGFFTKTSVLVEFEKLDDSNS